MSTVEHAKGDAAVLADPVSTEVIRYGLEAAADQMRVNLCRTAFSPVIYDVQDFAAALYDRDVRLLAQARSVPGFLGTMGFCIESIVERVGGPESLQDGDVLFSTYGYDIGSHPQDAAVVVPGFFEGELIGYAVIKGHHLDIGAKDPYCSDTTDIFQEGAIFPGVRIFSAGVRNEEMYRTILANSRAPVALAGDLNAQIGSARVGLQELNRLLTRFGRERFEAAVERIFDHGERVMREFIRGLADGQYRASGVMDDNCLDLGVPVPLEVTIDVDGDELCIDLSDSADQQRGPINSPRAMSVSYMRCAMVTLAGLAVGVNEGHFRAFEIKTRPGSVFEPLPPAPMFLYPLPGAVMVSLVQKALADALPEVVPADAGAHGVVMTWGNDARTGFWVEMMLTSPGLGASHQGDMTAPLMPVPASGLKSTPAEVAELSGHIVVERLEYAPDSGGAGKFRGGPGVDAVYRARDDQMLIAIADRTVMPPWGLHGGKEARANRWQVRFPDGTVDASHTKVTSLPIPAGTRIEHGTSGGGGFGPPSERDPQAVLEDVREGLVTEEAARRDYPHAFADAGSAGTA